jgi:hypothetical protein
MAPMRISPLVPYSQASNTFMARSQLGPVRHSNDVVHHGGLGRVLFPLLRRFGGFGVTLLLDDGV